jgi:hypothetical protein
MGIYLNNNKRIDSMKRQNRSRSNLRVADMTEIVNLKVALPEFKPKTVRRPK